MNSVYALKQRATLASNPASSRHHHHKQHTDSPIVQEAITTAAVPPSSLSFRKNRAPSTTVIRKRHHPTAASAAAEEEAQNHSNARQIETNIKIALVGPARAGKTALVHRFTKDRFPGEYVPTRMISLDEKRVRLKRGAVNLALCDVGSADQNNLYLACSDAQSICFCFDLTKLSSLVQLQPLFERVQLANANLWMNEEDGKAAATRRNRPVAIVLVGCKYDLFDAMEESYRLEVISLARKYCLAMQASALVFTSSKESINVFKLVKIIVGAVEDIDCHVESRHALGEPLIEY